MKKILTKGIVAVFVAGICFNSCTTTAIVDDNIKTAEPITTETVEESSEEELLNNENMDDLEGTENSQSSELETNGTEILQEAVTEPVVEEVKEEVPEKSPEEIAEENFIASLNNVNLALESAPVYTSIYGNFVRPFTFTVKDNDGNPLGDYPVTIKYPSSKEGKNLIYTTENVKTDSNGEYAFTYPKTSFSGKGEIIAYPTPVSNKDSVVALAESKAASAPWKVKTDKFSYKNQLSFVWDYNERGRPENNSSAFLTALKAYKISVGNAPMSDESYLNKSLKTVYADNYDIVGDAFGYLFVGTIKFAKKIEQVEGGYLCSLIGDMKVLDMKNGSTVYSKVTTTETTGKTYWESIANCRDKIAEEIVDSLLFEF